MSEAGTLLIVDDEPNIRSVCERVLKSLGYATKTAENGARALEALAAGPADLVLTDVNMPGSIDGHALLEQVRKRWPQTDVVIMTAFPDLESALPALRAGAYDYLIKPFEQALLKSVVQRCFEKRGLAAELAREKEKRKELEALCARLQADIRQAKSGSRA